MTTIVGYGSLLSEQSARETAPSLENFRLVRVDGYMRVFSKAATFFFERGLARNGDRHVASCATRAHSGHAIVAVAFDCNDSDLARIYEREHRYWWAEAGFVEIGAGASGTGRMCVEFNDRDYRLNKCGSAADYHRRVGQYYSGAIWRDDILPHPIYLGHCLRAAGSHGQAVLDNFLDTSFLADGVTSLRAYIAATPGAVDEGVYSYR